MRRLMLALLASVVIVSGCASGSSDVSPSEGLKKINYTPPEGFKPAKMDARSTVYLDSSTGDRIVLAVQEYPGSRRRFYSDRNVERVENAFSKRGNVTGSRVSKIDGRKWVMINSTSEDQEKFNFQTLEDGYIYNILLASKNGDKSYRSFVSSLRRPLFNSTS